MAGHFDASGVDSFGGGGHAPGVIVSAPSWVETGAMGGGDTRGCVGHWGEGYTRVAAVG